MKICVVGLGNIGLNLLAYLREKFPGKVVGVDIDSERINKLQQEGYEVTANYSILPVIDVWLLVLSTGDQGQNLFAALEQMSIRSGTLISIESTLPLGTMERVRNYLSQKGFTLGLDVFLIHVPHRIMFGVDKTICDTPRVLGAFTKDCLERGREFYAPLVPDLMEVADVRVAELSKVVENVKRYVDVAFAQEIYRYCAKNGIDFDSLRAAVNSKANVELLGTDWGIGGECLPKDIGFLRSVFDSPLLDGAERADAEYRNEIVRQVGNGQKVLLSGLSFKPGVKDLKYSRGVDLVKALEANANTVWVDDPLFTPEELAQSGFRLPMNQTFSLVLDRQQALNPKK
ncbi:MAG: NAD-binding protein [Desulfitobacteriaceae bacterium]